MGVSRPSARAPLAIIAGIKAPDNRLRTSR
jgi:hypothetical protein